MLIVISSPDRVSNEMQMVHYLLENGLDKFHVRKPNWEETEVEEYIQGIDPKFHDRLVIHQQLDRNLAFNINSIHLSESDREIFFEVDLEDLNLSKIKLSTSIHSMKSYSELKDFFEYCYLSPVFDSISKKGYLAMNEADRDLSNKKDTKIVALGGITSANAQEAMDMGFDGIAVLGSIWENENWKEEFHLLISITSKCYEQV